MNWLKKRLKSKTIWLTSIAPSALLFMTTYESDLKALLDGNYQYVFMVFAVLAWISRETTSSKLSDK